ncbi:MAG TPA: hypothetical protein VFP40_11410 [Terriglobales bacterium]|nr:hypothetical protein [Terriglobales bacterium]
MKRAITGVAVFILSFTFLAHADEKNPLTFTETMSGDFEDRESTKAGFHTYLHDHVHLGFRNLDSSDGEKVTVYNAQFSTADEAERYFDWTLKKKAARIFKQENRNDRDGKSVGRRAEFLLKSDPKTKEWEVIWTDQFHFVLVSAPSLECAEEIYRQSGE